MMYTHTHTLLEWYDGHSNTVKHQQQKQDRNMMACGTDKSALDPTIKQWDDNYSVI